MYRKCPNECDIALNLLLSTAKHILPDILAALTWKNLLEHYSITSPRIYKFLCEV